MMSSPASMLDTHEAIPAELENIVLRCLQKVPEERFKGLAVLAVLPFAAVGLAAWLVLARRSRGLLLDARAAVAAAPAAARWMAQELGKDEAWQQAQVAEFRALAEGYLPGNF